MNLKRKAVRPLRALHDLVMIRLRSSPRVTRALFGVSIPPGRDTLMWDYTTLVLRHAIQRYVRDGMRVWDVGCGPAAIISLFVARCAAAEITASDREPECVSLAREAVDHMGLTLRVVESDLGQQVPGVFDMVVFNPPYLPLGNDDLMPAIRPRSGPQATVYNRRFGGGSDGHQTIARFLSEVPASLAEQGYVLLGFNTVYVPLDRVREEAVRNGFRVVDCVSSWWNPSRVVVLQKSAAGGNSATGNIAHE